MGFRTDVPFVIKSNSNFVAVEKQEKAMMSIRRIVILIFFFCIVQARISPDYDLPIYSVTGCISGKFHSCNIIDIFVLTDEATILSIVNINNGGPWNLPTSYLELMNRNGSTVQFSTSIIGDVSGRCNFGAKFIPYYNNSQGNAVVLMCSSFTFPGGDTAFFRLKIDPLTSNITAIGNPLIFHSENSFARFSSQPVTNNNDVYFLLNSYPSGSNNYSVGHLNLIDFTFETWPVVHSLNSSIFLDPQTGTFNNVARIDKLHFSVPCSSPQHLSTSVPEMLCTYKYSNEKQFILIGMNSIPNARSDRNLYLYSPEEQQWGLTITSDPVTWSVLIMNTQFTLPTNSSRDLIYGAILNDTDAILTYTMSASISQVRNRCFYLATVHSRKNALIVQQLKFGEDFKRTPTILVDSTIIAEVATNFAFTIVFATKNYVFVLNGLNIYRYIVAC
ncbi:unnamed protein product [Rotaria sp. Silwood2]|nr:unnamed protein product [Rotaria sp. Silwood2]CAF4459498.1 unnamed protein product [Rotaria sp. Silwood2]